MLSDTVTGLRIVTVFSLLSTVTVSQTAYVATEDTIIMAAVRIDKILVFFMLDNLLVDEAILSYRLLLHKYVLL